MYTHPKTLSINLPRQHGGSDRHHTSKNGINVNENENENHDGGLEEYEDTCGARAAARTLRVDHGREGWWISAVRESRAEESLQAGGEGWEWTLYVCIGDVHCMYESVHHT